MPDVASIISSATPATDVLVDHNLWKISVYASLALLSLIAWLAKSALQKMDKMNDTLNGIITKEAVILEKLETHMADDNRHCHMLDCPNVRR